MQDCLLGHGIKPSVQRLAVMEYLKTHCTHPTADRDILRPEPEDADSVENDRV